MSRLISRQVRRIGALAVAVTLSMVSLPLVAQAAPLAADCSAIQFEVANPSAGSRIDPGAYVIQGVALDTRAEEGPGIDHIDFFLGNRDEGGVLMGRAVPGAVASLEGFGPNSYMTTISVPNLVGGRDLVGYAHSAVTDQENVIALPVAVGVEPSKVAAQMAVPPLMTCTGGPPASPPATEESELALPMPEMASMSEMAAAEPMAQASDEAPPAADSLAARMFLDVGNPSAGDTIHLGRFMIEGIAFDRAADQGAGIEHIDIFIGDRDNAGVLIGHGELRAASPVPDDPQLSQAGWKAQVTVPRTMLGPRTMFVYALSAITGGEMVVGIPVVVVP